jgi:hypothetical protein
MRSVLLGASLLASLAARAQAIPASGPTWASFIPAGYQLLRAGQVTGDLNGDGRPDVALALAPVAEDTASRSEKPLPPRLLLVLWRTATGYRLAAQARQALPHHDSSFNGDPYDGLAIKRGVLVLAYEVGGNWGRSTTVKFGYRQDDFYLIGETEAFGTHHPDCANLSYPPLYRYRDTNFVTGAYEVLKTSEACQLLVHKRGWQPVRPLRKLVKYKPVP